MFNEKAYELGAQPNAIREIFAYGMARKAEIGADKVFDLSIGNPSIPAPDEVCRAILELAGEPSLKVHGYTPAQGLPTTRAAIAASLNRRFGNYDLEATPEQIYLATGAAAALSISFKALAEPDDEFIVVSPYFPEYKVWIENAGGTCVEVPARASDFQLDLQGIAAAITPHTKGIVLNSPNNPTGVVYSRETLEALAEVLTQAQAQLTAGRPIFVISDEPYREIVYEGVELPYLPALWPDTIVAYSYSKSLSLPGERIGYIYVSERATDAKRVFAAVSGAGRQMGFVCAPALFQAVIERCVDVPSDVGAYAENRDLLTHGLHRMGYTFIDPQGAFYLWMKSLEADEEAFCERAKAYELLLVPGSCFGCSGWVRIGFCTDKDTIARALPAFEALMEEYRAAQ